MNTKLVSTLPKDEEFNGSDRIGRRVAREGTALVVGLVDEKSRTVDADTGETTISVRFHSIEAVQSGDVDLVDQALRRARENRTGRSELPLQ